LTRDSTVDSMIDPGSTRASVELIVKGCINIDTSTSLALSGYPSCISIRV